MPASKFFISANYLIYPLHVYVLRGAGTTCTVACIRISKIKGRRKKVFHEKHLAFHAELVKLLRPFIRDEGEAVELGWLLICASFGYRQVFITLELNNLVDFPVENFAKKITHYLGLAGARLG